MNTKLPSKQLSNCCKTRIKLTGSPNHEDGFACEKCERIIGTDIDVATKLTPSRQELIWKLQKAFSSNMKVVVKTSLKSNENTNMWVYGGDFCFETTYAKMADFIMSEIERIQKVEIPIAEATLIGKIRKILCSEGVLYMSIEKELDDLAPIKTKQIRNELKRRNKKV